MEILPAIDLRDGKVVRLLQGDYDRQIDYGDDPAEVARRFEQQGARWLHVVDLDGARSGRPQNLPVVRRIVAAVSLGVQFGGGVRSTDTVDSLLELGAKRVVIGTAALLDWDWFSELAALPRFARQVMLGLDGRQGRLAIEGWTETTGLTAVDVARRSQPLPLGGIVCTDISADGMLAGPNLAAIAELVAATSHPVIASGGVHTVADIVRLAELKVAGAIIGRALYEGQLSLPEALSAARRQAGG